MNFSGKVTYRKALTIPFRVTPFETALWLLSEFINLVTAPVSVLLTAYFIDTAFAVFNNGLAPSAVVPPIAALVAFQLYGYLSAPLLGLLATRVLNKTRLTLRVPLLEKYARLEFKHLENAETADLLSRVWNNPESTLYMMLPALVGFILLVGTTVSYAVILLANAPLAGVIIIVLSVPIFYLAMKNGRENYDAYRDMTKRDRLIGVYDWCLTAREAAAERNLFGYTKVMNDKYYEAYESARKYRLGVDLKWYVSSKFSSIVMGLLSSAALFILAPSVVNGNVSVGLYISLVGALFSTVNNIGWSLPRHFQQFTEQREYLKDFNKFLELSETPDAEVLPSTNPPAFESLEFRNVTFTYPGTEKRILDGLSFVINKGKNYSFVGVNGAGKTTITKLITRLYDDYDGEILLNGKNLREYSMADVKASFCAVFQDFARYDVTVAENVAIGKINGATGWSVCYPNATSSDSKPARPCILESEIDNAINLAGFSEKVKELKDGKNTLLGKTQDEGVDLSGGEWQRVAFARAIVSPAGVKILDEPTAALDPVAESQVYAQFEEISRGITTLFISHRLASAKLADVIYVLDGGKVAEQGGHDELMKRNGLYAEMFESQRSWYIA